MPYSLASRAGARQMALAFQARRILRLPSAVRGRADRPTFNAATPPAAATRPAAPPPIRRFRRLSGLRRAGASGSTMSSRWPSLGLSPDMRLVLAVGNGRPSCVRRIVGAGNGRLQAGVEHAVVSLSGVASDQERIG